MTTNCVNTCSCKNCLSKKGRMQFHISIDPNTHPHEFQIALILKKQKAFNRLFREFLKEYAVSVANQVKQEPVTSVHQ